MLTEQDMKILRSIEQVMAIQLKVKIEDIKKKSGFTDSFIEKKISFYNKIELIESQRINDQYISVRLKFMGYDALGLYELVGKNIIKSIGAPIGIGKESNVFEAVLDGNENINCILKFHKLGKTKFKATKRRRDFLAEKKHSSRLYESSLNAKREVEALKELAGTIPVPQVFGFNRHIIAMQKIDGLELFKYKLSETEYFEIYNKIVDYIKLMVNSGIIHGDLSVYNILLRKTDNENKIFIIDWPQYVRIDHKNALDILLNDISNIFSYFSKRTKLEVMDIEKFGTELLKNAKKTLKVGI